MSLIFYPALMPNTKENDTNTDPLLLPAKKKKNSHPFGEMQ